MIKFSKLLTLPLVAATGSGLAAAQDKSDLPIHPNIIIILGDDVGYGDLACYGAKRIKTPALDQMAANGIKFTSGYASAATCTPTRYSLITGEYAWRKPGTGILRGDANLIIDPSRPTIATQMKKAGYRTGIVGKWHLGLGMGKPVDWNVDIKPGPMELGFDKYFGMAATNDRVPSVYISQHRVDGLDPSDPITVSYRHKVGNMPTGKENPELLKMKSNGQQHNCTIVNGVPRIGYMSGGASALWDDETMTSRYLEEAQKFITTKSDKPFFLYFGLHQPHVPKVPSKKFKGTSACGTRGDLIQELDWSVGQIMETLEKSGLDQNTLVIFTSDNGGTAVDGYFDNGLKELNGHVINGPFKGGKYSTYEGGTRMPFIAYWPKKIKQGRVSSEVVSTIDFMATVSGLAGVKMPANGGPDSFDFSNLLLDEKAKSPRETLVTQGIGDNRSIIEGKWKLIQGKTHKNRKTGKLKVTPSRLYNLEDDMHEDHNLAMKEPARVKDLLKKLNKITNDKFSRAGGTPVSIR